MSALVELQDRIQSTTALIAEHERAVAQTGEAPPRSLFANIRALEKLKHRLESDYLNGVIRLLIREGFNARKPVLPSLTETKQSGGKK